MSSSHVEWHLASRFHELAGQWVCPSEENGRTVRRADDITMKRNEEPQVTASADDTEFENLHRQDGRKRVSLDPVFFDPDLPADARRFVETALPQERQNPEFLGDLPDAHTIVCRTITIDAVLWILLWALTGRPGELTRNGMWGLGGVVIVVSTIWAVMAILSGRYEMGRRRRLQEARERYVLPEDLTAEGARDLMARAVSAARSVQASAVYQQGLIDRQRVDLALPSLLWQIATDLRAYSLCAEQEPENPTGEELARLLSTLHEALRVSREGIGRRVAAMEEHADEVAKADCRHEELRQIRMLIDGSTSMLDLLARTARDGHAIAAARDMTKEATTVTQDIKAELEAAELTGPGPAAQATATKSSRPGR